MDTFDPKSSIAASNEPEPELELELEPEPELEVEPEPEPESDPDPDETSEVSVEAGDRPDLQQDEKESTNPTKAASPIHDPGSETASLWCPRTSRSHAALYDWNILRCPACGQSLRTPEATKGNSRRGRAVYPKASKPSGSTGPDGNRPPSSSPGISCRSASSSSIEVDRALIPSGYGARDPSGTSGPSGPPGPLVNPGLHPGPPPPGYPPGPLPAPPPGTVIQPPQPFGTDPYAPLPLTIQDAQRGRPDVIYQIQFLYKAGREIGWRPYHELLDLQKERDAITENNEASIFRIRSVVHTSIRSGGTAQDRDNARRIMSEGILRNPKYEVEVISEDITITSRRIIDVLKKLTAYYPAMILTGDDVTLKEPYAFAFHNMENIHSWQKEHPDDETRRQLKVLCDAVELKHGTGVEQEMARHAAPVPRATFKMLWLLFKPGETVYTQLNGGWQACVVKEVIFQHHTVCKLSSSYNLILWYLDFDGRRLGRCKLSREVAPFEGEMNIMSLDTFPARYLDEKDGGKRRESLEARGEKYYRYLKGAHVYYRGESLGSEARQYNGQAIIDIAAYYRYGRTGVLSTKVKLQFPVLGEINDVGMDGGITNHQQGPSPGIKIVRRRWTGNSSSDSSDDENTVEAQDARFPWRLYESIDPKRTTTLELRDCTMGQNKRHRYLLCPKRVIGFMLKSRIWEQLDIECCHKPRNNCAAIDTLVMSDERKTMIKALVYRYTNRPSRDDKGYAPWAADFIDNKGEGQIFLLHGSPGVGKTYTAECIAESTGRPLLSLTCGDIGNDEETLESRLSKWFRLAEIWNAVMLLDEADVFLERRATADLHRNSLVTVFLRAMEYYRGILFLTTNRVGHFDDAFISRIHVVLRYENLTNADRERIWNQFFDKLKTERGKYIEISREAKKYVLKNSEMTSIPWNGREIRNTFQTAVALAEYRFVQRENKEDGDKASLDWEDFEKVCRMSGAFKGYLQSIHQGADESHRAMLEMARNDAFVESFDDTK